MAELTEIRPSQVTPLATNKGKTTIADVVVAKLVTLAAKEVEGIQDVGGQGLGGQIAGLTQQFASLGQSEQGVHVEVGEREVAIDLQVIAHYGVRIPDVTTAVRQNIIDRVESLLGLIVKEVNIKVSGLHFPDKQTTTSQTKRVA